MRLVAEPGAWTTGPTVSNAPVLAVLEVSGAVLAWTVDGTALPRVTVTDVAAADWLWRLVGPAGHASISAALDGASNHGSVDLVGVELLPAAVDPLRRLAVGHWLRRWWPESRRDGIVGLDRALLDGELALLTSAAEEFFTEDTLDSDVDGLLAPHRAAFLALEADHDPRVSDLARACEVVAAEAGIWPGAAPTGVDESARGRSDDYALAAGPGAVRTPWAITRGVDSVNWLAVPPGIFDAAERTIEWSVSTVDDEVLVTVRVATTGRTGVRGIEARLRSGAVHADGLLDANGVVAMTLRDAEDRPLTETQAWDHDWSTTAVDVGPDVPALTDSAVPGELRQRVRDVARVRLEQPGPDAFLAELLAGESDY